jgi:hypothetical protein
MNIKNFTASINNKGILKNNRFEAQIGFAKDSYLSKSRALDSGLLTLRCDSVTLPGLALASADGPPRLGYGPIEKHPYSPLFEDLTLTFIVDAGSQIHKMFYDWVGSIVNFEGYGATTLNKASTKHPTKAVAYEVGYRDQYAATLTVKVYRDTNQPSMTFTAYNAFPMGIPQMNMNWNEGDVLRLNIPFAYTDFIVEYAKFNDGGPVETGKSDPQAPQLTLEQQIEQGLASLGGLIAPIPG